MRRTTKTYRLYKTPDGKLVTDETDTVLFTNTKLALLVGKYIPWRFREEHPSLAISEPLLEDLSSV